MGHRAHGTTGPQGKAGLIPAKAFEHERAYLVKLRPIFPRPIWIHERGTDQYGYVAFDGNYYWVPGTKRDEVKVLEYGDRLKIYLDRRMRGRVSAAGRWGEKPALQSGGACPRPGTSRTIASEPTEEEEKRLRAMGAGVAAYLDFALKPTGASSGTASSANCSRLSQTMTPPLFVRAIERALQIPDRRASTPSSASRCCT